MPRRSSCSILVLPASCSDRRTPTSFRADRLRMHRLHEPGVARHLIKSKVLPYFFMIVVVNVYKTHDMPM